MKYSAEAEKDLGMIGKRVDSLMDKYSIIFEPARKIVKEYILRSIERRDSNLIQDIRNQLLILFGTVFVEQLDRLLKDDTRKTYSFGLLRGSDLLVPLGIVVIAMLNREANRKVDILTKKEEDLITGSTDQLQKDILVVVADAELDKVTPAEVGEALDKAFDKHKERVKVIIESESMLQFNEALKQIYKENGIETVIWFTALDERVCDFCAPKHGKKFPVNDVPSTHPRCRCIVTPSQDD
jgi:SPP1 gp7 family putative phage head morphogenesis protein